MTLTRRQVYRRRRLVVFSVIGVVLIALLSGLIYSVNAIAAPLPATSATLAEVPALTQPASPVAWPDFGRTAIGAVGTPGLLATAGDQSTGPIASITKMITALVVLDKHPLGAGEAGPDIAYTEADIDIYWETIAEDGSSAPVSAGMTLSQRQTLTAVLLPSANNYAQSLAIWAYGSMDAYLAAANAWLAEHGLTDTHVVDASGLSAGSVSSPANLVEIGKLALAQPALAEIVAMKSAELPTIGTVVNTNKLLGTHGVTGMKTGTTDEAGACLLYTAVSEIDGQQVTLVGATLGADTHSELNDAVAGLLDSTFAGFHTVSLTEAGQQWASYSTVWGDTATAESATSASMLVWSDTPVETALILPDVSLAADGTNLGSVTFSSGGRSATVPITLHGRLGDPGVGWKLANPR
ncbi:D-alanyl-D-alanine carboxypeptidase family protein [Microterricola pindariensis]|uniref:D-alanyl-D-alanine carboxypeptidase family protein n=1 Tax=Microterricola pindariensis TaxID=478010 RepID=UPI0010572E64|nr:D-alanyl-D-alanine carboxypeptidase [Microterricola pindariensis]